jgi:parallel beta-helix repeat protein
MYGSGKAATAVLASALMVVSTLVVLSTFAAPHGASTTNAPSAAAPAGPAAGGFAPSPVHVAAVAPQVESPCTVTVSVENVGDNAIQTAINGASSGDIICIGPGTWPEQLTISTPDLTLRGAGNGSLGTILEPSTFTLNTYDYDSGAGPTGTPSAAIILVEGTSGTPSTGTTGVAIDDLQVNGANAASSPTFTGCNDGLDGIVFQASSGSVNATTVTGIELPSGLFGCQQGLAIYVYDGMFNFPTPNAPDSVAISNSTVTAYDKNGVTCDDQGETCGITSNTITGIGSTSAIAQNGVQVAYGAKAVVSQNSVSGNAYAPTRNVNYFSSEEGNAAAGILGFDAGNVLSIEKNTLSGNTQGISIVGTASSTVLENTIRQGDAYGITFDMNASLSYLFGLPIYSTVTPWSSTASDNVVNGVNVGILVYDDNVTISGGSMNHVNVSVEAMVDHAASSYAISVSGLDATANVSGLLLGNVSSYQTPGVGYYPKLIADLGASGNDLTAGAVAYPTGAQDGILLAGSTALATANTVGGFDIGINVDPSSATIDGNHVTVSASLGAPGLGIWAGNAVEASPDTHGPTATVSILTNTVTGPGGGAYTSPEAGSVGIQAAGASLTVQSNTVSGFSDAAGIPNTVTGYNWFQGTQSVAIMAACAADASPNACAITGNHLSDNVIGIVNVLWNSAFSGIYQTGPMTISDNTITDSLGYGIFQLWTNDGLASGPVWIQGNTIDNSASGALGMLLSGATFYVDSNVLIGTSASGTQGASEANWVGGTLLTESIAVVTGDEATTHVSLSGNVYLDTTLYTTYLGYAGSTFASGEPVTFTETGLPAGTTWAVTANGTTATSLGTYAAAQTTIAFQFSNGTHVAYWVAHEDSMVPTPRGGNLTVSGAPATVAVTFAPATSTVTFTETGLPAHQLAHAGWTVILNGTLRHATTASISYAGVASGTYGLIVSGPFGFDAHGTAGVVPSGQLVVNGPTSVSVTFAHGRTYELLFHETGIHNVNWCVTVNAYTQCSSSATIITLRTLTPATYTYAVGSVAGHTVTVKIHGTPEPTSGTLTLSGRTEVKVRYTASEISAALSGTLPTSAATVGAAPSAAGARFAGWTEAVLGAGAMVGLLGAALRLRRSGPGEPNPRR